MNDELVNLPITKQESFRIKFYLRVFEQKEGGLKDGVSKL